VDDDPERMIETGLARWRWLGWPAPAALVVSGSGLGVGLGPPAHGPVPLAEISPFPLRAVVGHTLEAELLLPAPDRPVLYCRGRIHGYQGYSANQVVFFVRLARRLGAAALVQTNAAGGLNPAYRPGDLVLIGDHLNLTGLNPLRGELPGDWGPRFPDLVDAYDPALRALAREHAERLGLPRPAEGVYAGLAGPSYETPAEVRMLRTLGADLGGMSTVLEVIAARHLGMRCLALSLVTNPAAGVTGQPLDHEEVLAAGRAAAGSVARLLAALIADPRLTG
jgi:purine-nucleoside phosphorylase